MKFKGFMSLLLTAAMVVTLPGTALADTVCEETVFGEESDIIEEEPAALEEIVEASEAEVTADTAVTDFAALQTAVKNAKAGTVITVSSNTGVIACNATLVPSRSGNTGSHIKLVGDGNLTLDFSSMTKNGYGIRLQGSYWDIEGIRVTGAKGVGMMIEGSHNTVKDCIFYSNGNTGLQISGDGSQRVAQWPAYNTILNCTSHNNFDAPNGEDADGFACKIRSGEGNVFNGCIAYHNIDDGWDLFAKDDNFPSEACDIINCITFGNGSLTDGTTAPEGDGNGFKLGSGANKGGWPVANRIKNCLSFGNKAHGFTDNNNSGPVEVYNCTSVDNNDNSGGSKRNFQFDVEQEGINENLLSVYTSVHTSEKKNDNFNGTIKNSIYYTDGYRKVGDSTAISSGAKVGEAVATALDENVFKTIPSIDISTPDSVHKTLRDAEGYIKLSNGFATVDAYSTYGCDLSGGKASYQSFDKPARPSSDFNADRIASHMVFIKKEAKYLNVTELAPQIPGGGFPGTKNNNPAVIGNDWFKMMGVHDEASGTDYQMNVGYVGTEADFLSYEGGEATNFTHRLRFLGDPIDKSGKAVGAEGFDGQIAGRVVSFTVDNEKKAVVTAYVYGSGSGNPGKFTVYRSNGSVYDDAQTVALKSKAFTVATFTVSEPGTFYLGTAGYNESTPTDLFYATQVDEDNPTPPTPVDPLSVTTLSENVVKEGKDGRSYNIEITAESTEYTGKKIVPKFVVKDPRTGAVLVAKKDYKVTFKNNLNANLTYDSQTGKFKFTEGAKTPTWKITFKKSYKKSKTVEGSFNIRARSLETAVITPRKATIKAKEGKKFNFLKNIKVEINGKVKKLNLKKDTIKDEMVIVNVTEGDAENKGKVFKTAEVKDAPAGKYEIRIIGQKNFFGTCTGGAFELVRK